MKYSNENALGAILFSARSQAEASLASSAESYHGIKYGTIFLVFLMLTLFVLPVLWDPLKEMVNEARHKAYWGSSRHLRDQTAERGVVVTKREMEITRMINSFDRIYNEFDMEGYLLKAAKYAMADRTEGEWLFRDTFDNKYCAGPYWDAFISAMKTGHKRNPAVWNQEDEERIKLAEIKKFIQKIKKGVNFVRLNVRHDFAAEYSRVISGGITIHYGIDEVEQSLRTR